MDGIPVILRGFDLAEHLVLALVHVIAVAVAAHGFEYRRAVTLTAVCDGCTVLGDLQRREQAVGLADSGLHGLAYRPGFAGKLFMVFCICHVAGGFGQLNAGALAEAEQSRVFIELIYAEVMSCRIEEDVAGVLDSTGDVQIAVRQMLIVLRVYPAERCKTILLVSCISACTLMVVPVFIMPSVSEAIAVHGLKVEPGA